MTHPVPFLLAILAAVPLLGAPARAETLPAPPAQDLPPSPPEDCRCGATTKPGGPR